MLPTVGVSNPASMRSRVDLPQPEEPSNAKISPFLISIETSSTTATSSKRLVRRSMRTKLAPSVWSTVFCCLFCMRNFLLLQTGFESGIQACTQAPDVAADSVRRHHEGQLLRAHEHRLVGKHCGVDVLGGCRHRIGVEHLVDQTGIDLGTVDVAH